MRPPALRIAAFLAILGALLLTIGGTIGYLIPGP
jgi:hypothetical protein